MTNKEQKRKRNASILGVIMVLVAGVLLYPTVDMHYGLSAKKYEADARAVLRIPDDWMMQKAVQKDCVAMLFYSADQTDSKRAAYETSRGNFLFGRTNHLIGLAPLEPNEIHEWHSQNGYCVLFSLNGLGIDAIHYDNLDTQYVHVVDMKPFVVILPYGYQNLCMYDSNGKEIVWN